MNNYEILLVILCLILAIIITMVIMQPQKVRTITRNYIVPPRIRRIFSHRYNDNDDKIIIQDDRNIYLNNRNTIYRNNSEYVNRVVINADGSEGNQETEVTNYSDTESPNNVVNELVNNSPQNQQNISMNITDMS